MEKFVCKCCGGEARWCNEGANPCEAEMCDHIHCDQCDMHYNVEMNNPDMRKAETMEEQRNVMRSVYLGQQCRR